MTLPWVIFDRDTPSPCSEKAEPDIAGIGVVLSFVLASLMTTIASIIAMLLDQVKDSKTKSSVWAPLKRAWKYFQFREKYEEYAWRPFLDPLIIGLGDQQLVTGYAVLLSGWIKVAQKKLAMQGAHFVLILYICALSSSSHLAALITLRTYFKRYKKIAKIRMALVIIFVVFLFTSMATAISKPPTVIQHSKNTSEKFDRLPRRTSLAFLAPVFLMLIGFSVALVCITYDPSDKGILSRGLKNPKTRLGKTCYFCLRPLVSFLVQIFLAVLSTFLVLTQKFGVPEPSQGFCGLQNDKENEWGFRQTLSIFMLLLPIMSAGQAYMQGSEHVAGG